MLASLFAVVVLGLQTPPKPNYTFVFFKSGTNKEVLTKEQREEAMTGHLGNLTRLWKEGISPAAGPFGDNTALRGIVVLKGDQGDAKQHFANDPFVKMDKLVVDAHPWFLPDDPFAKVGEDAEMKEYGVVLMYRGPKRGDPATEAAQRLASGHMSHLTALAKDGKVAAAGPFLDDGDLRGIVFFHTADERAALEALAKDPAVEAGWLRIEYHPLWMAKGILK
ncbi:MAG: YciI family protein [Fimbriimonadaceae bacterium]|nr:hypothetical protein [Chthonomonadaceae bacterium]MCO5296235.1 YciI family protein [Fimbriimonadaceae bacterium]